MDEVESSLKFQDDRPHVLRVRIGAAPLPFFAEYPYFLWGEVNYDSDGNCSCPTDRQWTELYLTNRSTRMEVNIQATQGDNNTTFLEITAVLKEEAWLTAYLTALRSGGVIQTGNGQVVSLDTLLQWTGDISSRLQAADKIRQMFLDPKLAPFDSNAWWGGWKWVGEFCTDMTSGLRAIMNAVHVGHARPDVLDWMRREHPKSFHRQGWEYAMRVLEPPNPPDARPLKPLPDFLKTSPSNAPKPPDHAWWKF